LSDAACRRLIQSNRNSPCEAGAYFGLESEAGFARWCACLCV